MFEQFIGWASATVIVWIFTEAILHQRGSCVAMVVKHAVSAARRHAGASSQRAIIDVLRKPFAAR